MKHLLFRKTEVLKTCWKSKFLREEIRRNALVLKSEKVQAIIWKMFILALLASAVLLQLSFVYKTVSQISPNLSWMVDKRLLSEFLTK